MKEFRLAENKNKYFELPAINAVVTGQFSTSTQHETHSLSAPVTKLSTTELFDDSPLWEEKCFRAAETPQVSCSKEAYMFTAYYMTVNTMKDLFLQDYNLSLGNIKFLLNSFIRSCGDSNM